jgi:hypothetical protein
MKRIFLFLLATVVLSFSLFAQEFSMGLDTSLTAAKTDVQDYSLYEKATPSFVLPFGKVAELAGRGFVKVAYSSADLVDTFTYGLDQFRYELALKKPRGNMSAFVFDMGRQDFSDPSGNILSSPADGLSFLFKYPMAEFTFQTAYTGLLFLKDSSISMSLADQTRSAKGTDLTGSPRFLVQTNLTMPQVFGQALTLSFLSQDDLNPRSALIDEGTTTYVSGKGGRLTTQYFELTSTGAVFAFGYNAFFAYGTGKTLSWMVDPSVSVEDGGHSYSYQPISSFLTGLSASVPLALPLDGSKLAFRFLFASGDKDMTSATEGNISEKAKCFVPINSPSLGAVFSPALGNIALGEASFAATPTIASHRINGLFRLISFFRPTSGPISVPGIDSTSSSPYLGTETDLSLSCGILSDVGISCLLGAFLPGSAFDKSYSNIQYSGNVSLTVEM